MSYAGRAVRKQRFSLRPADAALSDRGERSPQIMRADAGAIPSGDGVEGGLGIAADAMGWKHAVRHIRPMERLLTSTRGRGCTSADKRALGLHPLGTDVEHASGEIDLMPAQTRRFRPPHTCEQQQQDTSR